MKKKYSIIIGVFLSLICTLIVIIFGSTYTIKESLPNYVTRIDEIEILIENNAVEIADERLEDGILYLTLRSVHKGKSYVDIDCPQDMTFYHTVYVHSFGVITYDTFLGRSTGSRVIPIFITLYLALVLFSRISIYRNDIKENMYRYKNVKNIGLIIYLSSLVIGQALSVFSDGGILKIAKDILDSVSTFSFIALPIAFIVFVFVSISNIILMRKEGRNWRNMLGFFLGLIVCVCTVIPNLLNDNLQQTTLVDIHNEQGIAMYIQMLIEAVIFAGVTYLECILIGTVILGIKAAKRIPSFDKDYIMILGCQINSDGTLTPSELEKLAAYCMGEESVNRQAIDEICSEIPEGRILTEDKSVSTFENLKYSMELIRKHTNAQEPKIAFSTTNYHVFRAGIFATEQGIKAEGIGSKTKQYFFINAFVREFIATLVSEKKSHIKVMAVMLFIMFSSVATVYLCNIR